MARAILTNPPSPVDLARRDRIAPLEHYDLVRFGCQSGELVHGAAPGTFHEIGIEKAADIHAGAAEQDLTIAGQHPLQHPFDIEVAVRRLLAATGTLDGVRHEKRDDMVSPLGQGMRQAQPVVAAFRAVRRIGEDHKHFHAMSFCTLTIAGRIERAVMQLVGQRVGLR